MKTDVQLKKLVKERYGSIAKQSLSGCGSGCCSGQQCNDQVINPDYGHLDGYYAEADLGLGCGLPTKFAGIEKGHVVLDLGSGAGNDVFVTRALVGDSGKVIGVDMTEAMVAKANRNLAELKYPNVEFRLGEIENLPVNSGEIDVIISNCVLNLVPDKLKAFKEIYRVLKSGGHFCISDIVLEGELPYKIKSMAEMYAGCIAGALERDEYLDIIRSVGFTDVDVKKYQQFTLTDSVLSKYLSKEEIGIYRSSKSGIFSITVSGKKP